MSMPCDREGCTHYSDYDVYYKDNSYESLCAHCVRETSDMDVDPEHKIEAVIPQHGSDNVCLPVNPAV